MPDYSSILQEFIWQTEDIVPDIPKVHAFLNYWHRNIEATINQIRICDTYNSDWRNIDGVIGHG
jgi:uncharacterized protein Usg